VIASLVLAAAVAASAPLALHPDNPRDVAVEALVEAGKQYAVYLYVPIPDEKERNVATPRAIASVDLGLDPPSGRYRAEWIEPKTGAVLRALEIEHAGGVRTLASPPLAEDLALAVRGR
jgi:hypothetical protein